MCYFGFHGRIRLMEVSIDSTDFLTSQHPYCCILTASRGELHRHRISGLSAEFHLQQHHVMKFVSFPRLYNSTSLRCLRQMSRICTLCQAMRKLWSTDRILAPYNSLSSKSLKPKIIKNVYNFISVNIFKYV